MSIEVQAPAMQAVKAAPIAGPHFAKQAEPEFTEGEIDGVVVRPIKTFSDHRGWLAEIYREDELPSELHPVMAYVSQTDPSVVRGPHEHVDQTDLFVFLGPSDFEIYLWDARTTSSTRGNKIRRICGESHPCVVFVPPGVVHAYKNVGAHPGWVINAPNRLYAGNGKKEPVDEIRHEDREDSPFHVQ